MRFRRQSDDVGNATDDALARAAALTARGNYREAIDVLTAANRAVRDVRLESELVDLRYQAFAHSVAPSERPVLPESAADLFPGTFCPEIDAPDLTVEHIRSAILCHGSLIVRGLLSPERAGQLAGDVDRALDAYDAHREQRDLPDGAAWFQPFKYEPPTLARAIRRTAGSVLAVDSPRATFELVEAFEQCGIGSLVSEYFAEPAALLARKLVLRRVARTAGPPDWHQDGAFMGKNIRSLDVWIALSDCGTDAPGIDVVGRRLDDIVETGTEGARLEWTVGAGVVERVADGAVVRPVFAPGDALLFDHMNLHCTSSDPALTRERYAIEAWFFAPSTYASMENPFDKTGGAISDQIPIAY